MLPMLSADLTLFDTVYLITNLLLFSIRYNQDAAQVDLSSYYKRKKLKLPNTSPD